MSYAEVNRVSCSVPRHTLECARPLARKGGSTPHPSEQHHTCARRAGWVQICRATGGYTLPRLNSNLYLQGQRFRRISHLDKYTRLRVRLSPSVTVCVCVSV